MLAYQQISHHFASSRSPQRTSTESREKRSMSPIEMTAAYRKEALALDYVRHLKRSLSRSTSPVRSHSPTYMSHQHTEHLLIKRSMSEEDLRSTHGERRRLSLEQSENHHHHLNHHLHHAITHRPQILINYRNNNDHHEHPDDVDSDGENNNNDTSINNKNKKNINNNDIKNDNEQDDDAPLDLSMGSKKRRGHSESGTDSDDSTGMGDEGRGNEGRAYKKSLMKRYCEFLKILLFYSFILLLLI